VLAVSCPVAKPVTGFGEIGCRVLANPLLGEPSSRSSRSISQNSCTNERRLGLLLSGAVREIGWGWTEKRRVDFQLMNRRVFRLVTAKAHGSEMLSVRVGIRRAPASSHVAIISRLVGAWRCPDMFQRPLCPLW